MTETDEKWLTALRDTVPDDPATGIHDIFRASLQSTDDRSTKAAQIADKLRLFVSNAPDGKAEEMPWRIWMVIFGLLWALPPVHEIHDILAEIMLNFKKHGGPVLGEHRKEGSESWDDFPDLYIPVSDFWADPAWDFKTGDKPPSAQDIAQWMGMATFFARVTENGACPFPEIAMKHMKVALEKPFPEGHPEVAGPRLFVTHEYIMRSADALFQELREYAGLDESNGWSDNALEYNRRVYSGGPLCPDIEMFGFERWQFWKKRIGELRARVGELDFGDNPAATWLDEMLARMNEVEAKAGRIDKWAVVPPSTENKGVEPKESKREDQQVDTEPSKDKADIKIRDQKEDSESEDLKIDGGTAKNSTLIGRIKAKILKYLA